MDIKFKKALVVSTMMHCAIILPAFSFVAVEQRPDPPKPITVDYIAVKQPEKVQLVRENTPISTPAVETPKVELKRNVEMKPAAALEPDAAQKAPTQKTEQQDLAEKQARAKTTKDYISYYQLIREKIRQRLKANYISRRREGDVSLVFELSSDGKLVSLAIENAGSTTDRTLRGIAASSVKEAAPFAPFPKALALPRMSFNLVISFKKE